MPKLSPFYTFIQSISPAENHYDIKAKHTLSAEYFLIELPKSVMPLFGPPYTLSEAHFRIDKLYSKKQGYSPIHYTQTYTALDQPDKIVHGYLNFKGEYLSSDMSSLTPEQESQIKADIQSVLPILAPLIKKYEDTQKTLKEEADTLESELSDLSYDLEPGLGKDRSPYLEKAYRFIQKLEALNAFSVDKDLRGKIVKDRIEKLEAIQACLCKPIKIKKGSSVDVVSDNEAKSEIRVLSKDEQLKWLYNQAFNDLTKALSEFNSSNLPILEKIHSIQTIYDHLFIVYSFPSKLMPAKKEKKLRLGLEKINSTLEAYNTHLNGCISNGDVEGFKATFLVAKSFLKPEMYAVLVKKLLEAPSESILQKNQLAIAEYVGAHDKRYQAYIKTTLETQRFSFPKNYFDGLKVNSECKEVFTKWPISLLMKLCIDNKFNLFCHFLKYQNSTYSWAMIEPCYGKTLFTLFYSITLTGKNDYIKYLKKLLEYGVDPNVTMRQELCNQTKSKIDAALTKQDMRTKSKMKGDLFSYTVNDVLNTKIDIVQELGLKDIEALKIILPKASLHSLMKLSIKLCDNIRIRTVRHKDSHFQISLKEDFKQRQPVSTEKSDENFFISTLFYPNSNNTEQDNSVVKIIYEKVNLLNKSINEKIQALTLSEFTAHYQSFLRIATITSEVLDKHYSLLACENLLMTYASKNISCVKQQRDFIKKYHTQLYNLIISNLQEIKNKDPKEQEMYLSFRTFYSQKIKGERSIDQPLPPLLIRISSNANLISESKELKESPSSAFKP